MKVSRRTRTRRVLYNMRFSLILLAAFVFLSLFSIFLLRTSLLESAQETGTALARSYAMEEQNNLTVYETLLSLGSQYLEAKVEAGATDEELRDWLANYFQNITQVLGKEVVDPYAAVAGHIVAANPWDGDEDYDYSVTDWYQAALEADGDIVVTDSYADAISGNSVVTLAQKCGRSNTVVAFDVFPDNFKLHDKPLDLPEGGSYYLCDRQGTLLYYQTPSDLSRDTLQSFLYSIFDDLSAGVLDPADAFIDAPDGTRQVVYYATFSSGWISVVTLPAQTILADLNVVIRSFAIAILLFLAGSFFMLWRDFSLNQRIERTNETVRVLGNSYFSLYRINCLTGSYEVIKGSGHVRSRLEPDGAYPALLSTLAEVIEPDARAEFTECFSLENIRKKAKRERDFGGDFLRLFNGEFRWVSVRALADDSLAPGEVVLCFKEVDREKRQEIQRRALLEDALAQARKSTQAKTAFFSHMSHDMRTPLNAVIGLTELAETQPGNPPATRDYLAKIAVSGRQLLGLINDILELSRIESGALTLNPADFDLSTHLQEWAGPFQAQAQREGKQFEVICELRDSRVRGDAFRIGQILNNLLSNAFKFTPAGGTVRLQLRQVDPQPHPKYQILVQDTGCGMTEDFLARIFEPYAQETRSGAAQAGTGLGMPIVKSLVEQMAGTITVTSRVGEGSTFTVTLPLECAEAQPETAPTEAQTADPATGLAGLRLMLVDDNELNREIGQALLEQYGAQVTTAFDGQDAVEQFAASAPGSFDAILMDMQMPRLDGCGAARAIRALERPDAATVPIVAVTANAFAEDIAQTTEAGMNAHVPKPIDYAVLTATLHRLLGRQ